MASGTEPRRDADEELVLTEETGVVLVLIPAGSFWMGAIPAPATQHNYDPDANVDEGPVHEVELSAYFLSKYELTQAQWSRQTGRNPSQYKPPDVPNLMHPLEQVSWLDAMRWLHRMALTLPSEAQWEYGCRAGTETPWHFGDDWEDLRGRINIADKTAADFGAPWRSIQAWPDHVDGTALHSRVGAYPANGWGLHEVHGNVNEWCLDGYNYKFYATSPRNDPVGPWVGMGISRVIRGGGYGNDPGSTRSSYRHNASTTYKPIDLGIRPSKLVSE